jgi:hypothetical protein
MSTDQPEPTPEEQDAPLASRQEEDAQRYPPDAQRYPAHEDSDRPIDPDEES